MLGAIEAFLVGDHANLAVVVFRAEAEGMFICFFAGLFNRIAICVIDIESFDASSLRDICNNRSVMVIARDTKDTVDANGK